MEISCRADLTAFARMSDEAGEEWLLVGRDDEIGTIEAEYRRPGVGGVMLTGARGAGKSRVAREAAARLAAGGCPALWVAARRDMRSTPFGAIAHLVPEIADGRSVLSQLIGSLRAAGPDRMLMVVDDVHVLDDESAAVLAELMARRLIFLVGTVGPGGLLPEALYALWSSGRITCLPLGPLSAKAMDRLIDRLLGARLDVIDRRRLARQIGGNPLALRALMDIGALSVQGGFQQTVTGLWQAERAPDSLVHGLAGQWMGEAGPIVRGVVEVVACAEPIRMGLLETMVEPAAIDAAEQAGMVRVAGDTAEPTVRLAPPLSVPLVRLLLTDSTARRVYGKLFATLLRGPSLREEDVLRAGEWQLHAGTISNPEFLLPAAARAMARFDLELAAKLAVASRMTRPGPAADLLLARVLMLQGQSRRAANALPSRPDEPELAAAWALTTAEIQYFGLGEPAHVAERTLGTVIHGRHEAEAKRSWIQLADGHGDQALFTAQSVLARPDSGPQAKIWAAAAGAAAAGLLGRGALGEAIFQEGTAVLDDAARGQFPWGAAQVGYGGCLARLMCGDVRQAQDLADRGYAEAVAAGARSMAGIWAALRGMAAQAQGRVRFASRSLREALTLSDGEGLFCLKTVWTMELAAVTAMAGDTAEARRWLTQVDEYDSCHTDAFEPWIALGRAWTYVGVGELSRAVESCRFAAELSGKRGHLAHEAIALYDAARLGAAGDVRARLADLARTVEGDTVAVMAAAAQGLARRDGDALGQATNAFDRLGRTLLAAETATAASQAHGLGGRHAAAALFRERADSLARRCEGARTPLLDRWRLGSLLTRREQEVVLLASALTSPQIATRLGLSPRTVSNYLQHAYDKLGLTGRAELRLHLDRATLDGGQAGVSA